MQSLKKPPSGGFFYFRHGNLNEKKALGLIQVLFSQNSIKQSLQIHVQLHAAQGAAVSGGAAAVAHAAQ